LENNEMQIFFNFQLSKTNVVRKNKLKTNKCSKLNFKIAVNSVLITFAQSVQRLLIARVAYLKAHIEI